LQIVQDIKDIERSNSLESLTQEDPGRGSVLSKASKASSKLRLKPPVPKFDSVSKRDPATKIATLNKEIQELK